MYKLLNHFYDYKINMIDLCQFQIFIYFILIIYNIKKFKKECIVMRCSKINELHNPPYPVHYLNISHPNLYYSIINPKIKKKRIDYIISIPVAPYDIDYRNAIRRTWLLKSNQFISFFFMGMSNCTDYCAIENESFIYNDIVQFNFLNSYLNLTLLTILSINWILKNSLIFKYYIKIDRDVVANLKNIFNFIKCKYKNTKGIFGPKTGSFAVNRNNKSSSYIPYFAYNKRIAPAYVTGMIYIIDYRSLLLVNNISMKFYPIVYREDVHLGILSKIQGIKLIDIVEITDVKTYNYSKYSKKYVFHSYTPKEIYKLFNSKQNFD